MSHLQLWQALYSAEHNNLINFGRGHYEEHVCEIKLNLVQWVMRKCGLTIFLIDSSYGHLVRRSKTF